MAVCIEWSSYDAPVKPWHTGNEQKREICDPCLFGRSFGTSPKTFWLTGSRSFQPEIDTTRNIIDMPNRKGSVAGIIVALVLPILFAILLLALYGWKSWAINRQWNQAFGQQVEERAACTINSPAGRKYKFRYYIDDVHSERKRVQLLDTTTGVILWKYETDDVMKCAWRKDGKALAVQESVSGKSYDTTVVLLDDGNIRKIQIGRAIEKLLRDKQKHLPVTYSVELFSWKGDNLQVDWHSGRLIGKAGDQEVVKSTGWYELLLAINDDGSLLVVKATARKGADGVTF